MANFFSGIFSIDLRGFAVFRVCLGLLLIFDMALRSQYVESQYSDAGIYPIAYRLQDAASDTWSLHFINGSTQFNLLLFSCLASVGLCLIVGAHTRIAFVFAWVLLTSLHARLPGVNTGGDTLLRLLCFWSMFLSERPHADKNISKQTPDINTIGSACLLLQVCLIYWQTALLKSHDVWRIQSTAIQWALSIESFQGPLANTALLFPNFLKLLTVATLLLEELGPLVVLMTRTLPTIRTVTVISFILFHLIGIGTTMRLGIFPWVCAVAWIPFLPSQFWNWFGVSFGRQTLFLINQGYLPRSGPTPPKWIGEALPIAAFSYIVIVQVALVPHTSTASLIPKSFRQIGVPLGLHQSWALFAPRPATRDGWYVAKLSLTDGRVLDPLHGYEIPRFEVPPNGIAREYRDSRWHRLLHGMFYTRLSGQVTAYGSYVRRDCERRFPGLIKNLEIYFVLVDPWHPEDGTKVIQVFPFKAIDEQGRAIFAEDTRWNEGLNTPHLAPRSSSLSLNP